VTIDCDGNGYPDHCEIAWAQSRDCNLDGILDICQLTDPGMDCDLNDVPDACDLEGEAATDCDSDGFVDTCQIAQIPGADCDGDGWLDSCVTPSWTGPCRPAPWIGLFFDPGLTVSRASLDTLPTTGQVWIAVRDLPTDLGGAVDGWELSVEPPTGLFLYGDILPPGADDLGPGNTDWWVSLENPISPDANGDLVLVEMTYLVVPPLAPDSRIGLGGSSLSAVWSLHPILHDQVAGDVRLLDARSSWLDPTFEDCNHNDIDDAVDIAQGISTDTDGNGVPDECQEFASGPVSARLSLAAPSPNPFNPSTEVRFTMPRDGHARVDIFDFAGRRVRVLHNATSPAGLNILIWDGRHDDGTGASSGVYILRLSVGDEILTRKMALLK
jgi:hypothetical protein